MMLHLGLKWTEPIKFKFLQNEEIGHRKVLENLFKKKLPEENMGSKFLQRYGGKIGKGGRKL
ncbi:MAG: hypothetical protein J7K47_02870 [Thermoplasmata archaeon]|nr:hypothetical protein [Thermoplasmata archaeon]